MKHADTQKVEIGAAIHLALDKFQSIDVALRGTVAPFVGHGSLDRVLICL